MALFLRQVRGAVAAGGASARLVSAAGAGGERDKPGGGHGAGPYVAAIECLRRNVPAMVAGGRGGAGSEAPAVTLDEGDVRALDAWRDFPRLHRGFVHDLLARRHGRGPYAARSEGRVPYLPDVDVPPPLGGLHAEVTAPGGSLELPAPMLLDALEAQLASRFAPASAALGVDSLEVAAVELVVPESASVAEASRLGWATALETLGWLSPAGAAAAKDSAADAARAVLPRLQLWRKSTLQDILRPRIGFTLLVIAAEGGDEGKTASLVELANQVHASAIAAGNAGLDVVVSAPKPVSGLRAHLTQVLDAHGEVASAYGDVADFALVAPNGAFHFAGSLDSDLDGLEAKLAEYFPTPTSA
ncbi:uncharacterized protein AMSG_05586 [Thecamonas trahens ATCC 50062]|uniref:Uncharacterized protein n=1 Tax=Thecamonas trahens ATCC 50062 TaxID=461836 RepID=A0A0L0DE04_THETB|nr:hypothetical protein AMSG_05586 [Thecamonas trahens ATCC 50062]KNC49553.1 hypothetical protein AMSG_05586 [Thecamonas trahens ATCC 50062]|eukprot:XP_013757663.1 hypothetical protein AMSG_05586 [Thecamonas trahens ATCC 50062]